MFASRVPILVLAFCFLHNTENVHNRIIQHLTTHSTAIIFYFSLSRRVYGTHSDEVTKLIQGASARMSWKGGSLFVEGLRRGIAVHHSGLPRRYRTAVESLFRLGFLRVVFSTETLALGINMPCKSAVFIGDSMRLTPLMYRQTSGRAGRRGFDTFGHVVFWEVPFPRMSRLICANLPVLAGEFPITPTLLLRSFYLLNGVRNNHEGERAEMVQRLKQQLGGKMVTQLKQQMATADERMKMEERRLEETVLRLYLNPLFGVTSGTAAAADDNSSSSVSDGLCRMGVMYAFRWVKAY